MKLLAIPSLLAVMLVAQPSAARAEMTITQFLELQAAAVDPSGSPVANFYLSALLQRRSPNHPRECRRGHGALSCWRTVLPGAHAAAGAAQRSKKRIRALCRWHFGGGPGYCEGCAREGLACTRSGVGPNGGRCPYHEHALRALEEHQAWDVLMACLGQLRLAPSGHVLGIDMSVALEIAEARGHDLDVVSELLQATEAGLIESSSE